ncbi:hypothetical protein ACQEVI_27280 [Promicromonospora sp. CA-289599]|uniref:hypothetical protein n=1 Tax=Promicromonospora sp. CA-289599 TaxID=3240014 RepID=UPI003D91DFC2
MLRRAAAVLILFLLATLAVPSTSAALAAADAPPVQGGECPSGSAVDAMGQCVTVSAEDGGSNGSSDGGTNPAAGDKNNGSDDSGAVWLNVNGQRCLFEGVTKPQPRRSEGVWEGRTEGVILDCMMEYCVPSPVREFIPDCPMSRVWVAAAPGAPDPTVLAQSAVEQMNLQPIEVGIVPEDKPGSIGIVGMPQWMWVNEPTPNTFGPIEESATAGQYTVTATAKVDKTVWDMGDGNTVTCVGKGTPYEDRYDISDSPDCGYKYTKQGEYEVTATSYWTVQWEGMGQFGTIPVELASTASIVMGEAQVITQ